MTTYGTPERQCGTKRQYTKADAKKIARHTTTTYGGGARKCYHCPICGHWHIAHRKKAHHA